MIISYHGLHVREEEPIISYVKIECPSPKDASFMYFRDFVIISPWNWLGLDAFSSSI